jgi:hypothetical protein
MIPGQMAMTPQKHTYKIRTIPTWKISPNSPVLHTPAASQSTRARRERCLHAGKHNRTVLAPTLLQHKKRTQCSSPLSSGDQSPYDAHIRKGKKGKNIIPHASGLELNSTQYKAEGVQIQVF